MSWAGDQTQLFLKDFGLINLGLLSKSNTLLHWICKWQEIFSKHDFEDIFAYNAIGKKENTKKVYMRPIMNNNRVPSIDIHFTCVDCHVTILHLHHPLNSRTFNISPTWKQMFQRTIEIHSYRYFALKTLLVTIIKSNEY